MSSELPILSGAEVIRCLEKAGFQKVSQRGSHIKLRRHNSDKVRTVIVPLHRELALGTLRSILRQAGVSPEELRRLLNE